jgi:hypothetical protein
LHTKEIDGSKKKILMLIVERTKSSKSSARGKNFRSRQKHIRRFLICQQARTRRKACPRWHVSLLDFLVQGILTPTALAKTLLPASAREGVSQSGHLKPDFKFESTLCC